MDKDLQFLIDCHLNICSPLEVVDSGEENYDYLYLEEEIFSVQGKVEFNGKRNHYVKKLKQISQEAVSAFFNRHGIDSAKSQRLLEKVKNLQKKTHRSHKHHFLP